MVDYSIYRIRNAVNPLLYVGCTTKTLKERWAVHRHNSLARSSHYYNAPLYVAMRQIGVDCFAIEPIEQGYGSHVDMTFRERHWIKHLNTITPYGYNQFVYTLSNEDAAIIRYNAYGLTGVEYAALFGLSNATIYAIRSKNFRLRTYKHVTEMHLPKDIKAYAEQMGHTKIIESRGRAKK